MAIPPIIGITGKAGSGKDTFAAMLTRHMGTPVRYMSFAEPLKRLMTDILYFDKGALLDRTKKEAPDPLWGMSFRHGAQYIGGDMFRDHFHKDVWVIVAKHIMSMEDVGDATYIFNDVRHDNEAEMLHLKGGVVIAIERDTPYLTGVAAEHKSERGIMHHLVSERINNDGTLEDLDQRAKYLVEKWRAA